MPGVSWSLDPTVYIGCAGLICAYAWLARGRLDHRRRWLPFLAGVALLWAALESPLDSLGDQYLLSAHMLQHLALAMAVTPLLLLGLSPRMAAELWRRFPGLSRYGEPMPAMVIAMVTMTAWQAPGLFDWTLRWEALHIFAHLTMMVGGTLFWWPVLAPTADQCLSRLGRRARSAYLLMMALPMLADALLLGLWPSVLYRPYASDPRLFTWLTPLLDQRLAGLVVGLFGLSYLLVAGLLVARVWKLRPRSQAALQVA